MFAWLIAGYATKASAKRALIKLSEGIDFSAQLLKNLPGRPSRDFRLSCDAFKQFCMLAETEAVRAIHLYFIEAERNGILFSVPLHDHWNIAGHKKQQDD